MIHGVLFDFSGTLFRFEPGPDWPSADADEAARARLTGVLTAPTMSTEDIPPDLVDVWERRDLDPDVRHALYMGLLASSGVELTPAEADLVYASITDPLAWRPYPDTEPVLRGLRAAGVPVAVVSNVAWEIRSVFRQHGVADLVDEFVLSYVEGVVKPDPKIFTTACQRIGVAPEHALMVGDSQENDGGASAIGCTTVIVDPVPTPRRPSALRQAVSGLLPTVAG
jgi:HAD superfamily hydrolase (TIGR01509 family)